MIKSFRGQLASGGQDTIRLSTVRGETGYRIVKFDIFTLSPGIGSEAEHVVKVYKQKRDAVTGTVNFNNELLIGVGFLPVKTSVFATQQVVTFDNVVFNQDVYVTHTDNGGNAVAVNYHIELEQVKLSLDEATVATLKHMRRSN